MTVVRFEWHDYKYFPYESELAKREILALFGVQPKVYPDGLFIDAKNSTWRSLANRTTYFQRVCDETGLALIPVQAQLERSSKEKEYHHQVTRYSAHGLHEYKGKFNPQIVRVLGNILALQPGQWILDPFCGSGTSLLEAAHSRWNAVGVDLNPLAVMITNAKLASIHIEISELISQTNELVNFLETISAKLEYDKDCAEKNIFSLAGGDWQEKLS